jgi:hypothetical protein
MPARFCLLPSLPWFYNPIINPKQQRCGGTNCCQRPQEQRRPVLLFSKMMQQDPTNRSGSKRSNTERQKRKSHIGALLPRRRQARNVIVIARLLDQFAHGNYDQRAVGAQNASCQTKHRET